MELKSASVGDNKNIFFLTAPFISGREKKTKDPHLRMAAIILFTASIPAPIDPRVTGNSQSEGIAKVFGNGGNLVLLRASGVPTAQSKVRGRCT